eukprot:CCRYP_004254-RC/>CCRYP_004254-RC protein AED:0.47 eAED:0.47 QI:0/-1/0/1/-1/0/1/0/83
MNLDGSPMESAVGLRAPTPSGSFPKPRSPKTDAKISPTVPLFALCALRRRNPPAPALWLAATKSTIPEQLLPPQPICWWPRSS